MVKALPMAGPRCDTQGPSTLASSRPRQLGPRRGACLATRNSYRGRQRARGNGYPVVLVTTVATAAGCGKCRARSANSVYAALVKNGPR
jgi:hypothetical protein